MWDQYSANRTEWTPRHGPNGRSGERRVRLRRVCLVCTSSYYKGNETSTRRRRPCTSGNLDRDVARCRWNESEGRLPCMLRCHKDISSYRVRKARATEIPRPRLSNLHAGGHHHIDCRLQLGLIRLLAFIIQGKSGELMNSRVKIYRKKPRKRQLGSFPGLGQVVRRLLYSLLKQPMTDDIFQQYPLCP